MAASIPFTSIDDVILALAKIDVLHKHIAHAEGDASTIGPGDDFLLIPYCIHDVARGDLVEISSPELGRLTNSVYLSTECPPWTFGTASLMHNLLVRGLLRPPENTPA